MARRAAVIDIGTNSIKLLVAERTARGFKTIAERVRVARLGDGLAKSGMLSEEAMARGEATIANFVALAHRHGVKRIAAYGTHAIRNASNGAEFVKKIKEKTRLEIKTLSGGEEARFSYAAAVQAAGKSERILVFDAGGGSTEFILGASGSILRSQSTPVGALTLYDECMSKNDPPTATEMADASRLALSIFRGADEVITEARRADFTVVGVGGVISVLASVAGKLERFSRKKINGKKLTKAEIEAQIRLYGSCTLAERKKIAGMPPDRAQIAPAGAVLALAVLEYAGKSSLLVSANGLRHGAMAELLAR